MPADPERRCVLRMTAEDKVACRTPAEGRAGVTSIPAWKFNAMREAILEICEEETVFTDLFRLVPERLTEEQVSKLGSINWHVTTTKLELEVRGEITRVPGARPQKLIRM